MGKLVTTKATYNRHNNAHVGGTDCTCMLEMRASARATFVSAHGALFTVKGLAIAGHEYLIIR